MNNQSMNTLIKYYPQGEKLQELFANDSWFFNIKSKKKEKTNMQ